MSIRDHLRQGEAIISDHKPFYATSQRIILCHEKGDMEEVWDIPYARLISIGEIKIPHYKVLIAGTMAIVGGAMMSSVGFFTSWPAILLGVALFIYGLAGRKAFYQFHAHDMTPEEEARWRLPNWGSGSFVSTIRTIIGDRPQF
jgi:hypothetical protein